MRRLLPRGGAAGVVCTGVFCIPSLTGFAENIPGRPVPAASAVVSPLTYAGFLERARLLRPGMMREEIVAALGQPAAANATLLHYSLTGLAGFPGVPGPLGTQVFFEARIELRDGRMAAPVAWAWIDTAGAAPRSPRP